MVNKRNTIVLQARHGSGYTKTLNLNCDRSFGLQLTKLYDLHNNITQSIRYVSIYNKVQYKENFDIILKISWYNKTFNAFETTQNNVVFLAKNLAM